MDLIVEKNGVKWILKEAIFSGNKLTYKEAIPLELQNLLDSKKDIEAELDNMPSDEELLEWAKENHPKMSDLERLHQELDKINSRIEELMNLSFED